MERKTVRIRLDGENYEDVVCKELTWDEDFPLLESCRVKRIDQASMKEVEDYDNKKLISLRHLVMIEKSKTKPTAELLGAMPRRDRLILFQVWTELNEVGEAEKSSPLGKDNRGEDSEGGCTDFPKQGQDNKDLVAGE